MIIFRIMEAKKVETDIPLTFRKYLSSPRYLMGSVLFTFLVFFVVLLCDARCNFRIITIFGSSLPPVVCKCAHVLFVLFVFVYV